MFSHQRLLIQVVVCIFLFSECQYNGPKALKTGDNSKEPTNSTMENQHIYFSLTEKAPLILADSIWKSILSPEVYYIARKKGTEYAFSGTYWNFEGIGKYHCAACGNFLFTSDAKFASSCGWPSFFEPAHKDAMNYYPDNDHGMQRTEVTCGRCNGHLGHIFDDGPPPSGMRYCMNSLMLKFIQQ
jgi:peptide-methionine (R)-S-oxide reductase